MAESEYPEFDPQLELKDRLPYPQILSTSILSMKSVLKSSDNLNMKKIQVMILDLLTDLPDTWKDEQFEEELTKVLRKKTIDTRPMNAGVKMSKAACERMGIATTRTIKQVNYFRLKNAIIDLLDRRAMLIRKEKIEFSTGRNLDIEFLEQLDTEDEEE